MYKLSTKVSSSKSNEESITVNVEETSIQSVTRTHIQRQATNVIDNVEVINDSVYMTPLVKSSLLEIILKEVDDRLQDVFKEVNSSRCELQAYDFKFEAPLCHIDIPLNKEQMGCDTKPTKRLNFNATCSVSIEKVQGRD